MLTRKINFLFYIMLMVFVVFAAIRGNGNGDYFTYLQYSKLITDIGHVFDFDFPMEISFRVLSYAVNSVGLNSQLVLSSMAMMSVLSVGYIIYKYSSYKCVSLLIYFPFFLVMDMHASRTAVAAGFCLLSYFYFFRGKKVAYVLLTLFSASFHSASLISLILLLLNRLKIRTIYISVVVCYLLRFFVDFIPIVQWLLNSIGLHGFSLKISGYLTQSEYSYPMSLLDPRLVMYLLICSLLLFINNDGCSHFYRFISKLFMIGTLIMVAFSEMTILSFRLSYFFLIVSPVIIPLIGEKLSLGSLSMNIRHGRITAILFFCTIAFFYFSYTLSILNNYVPYKVF